MRGSGVALEEPTPGKSRRIDELARHWLAAGRNGNPTKAVAYAREKLETDLWQASLSSRLRDITNRHFPY